ncbi:MAG: RhuM family protein [Candidatus Paceibacterota bacterium]
MVLGTIAVRGFIWERLLKVVSIFDMKKENKDNIVIYEGKDGKIELRADIEKDTIWATQEQIGDLFDTERSVVTKHLRNVFKDKELQQNSVCANFAHTAADGKEYQVKYYNLDAVIAVGYRINSKRATQFRIWSTQILHDYLTNGYALNRYRLGAAPQGLEDLHKAIEFIESNEHRSPLKGKVTISLTRKLTP